MISIDQILLVDNNQVSNKASKEAIIGAGICENIKVAMNGGHALLCVNQMHTSGSISNKKLVVLLNIDTPIENGFVFLQQYFKNLSGFQKERILIIVNDENLSAEKKHKAQLLGISYFINNASNVESLSEVITEYFKTPEKEVRKQRKGNTPSTGDVSRLRVA